MNKQSTSAGSIGLLGRIRSLLAFRHESPLARLVSIVAAFATALLLAVGMVPAYAVHDTGQFELDGNTANNGVRDWADLFNASGTLVAAVDPNNGPILAASFKSDTTQPDTSYFSSSNKDGDSIGSWSCGPANNPLNKDDLQHAYAALIHIPGDSPDTANRNHDVLYLGSDRLDNGGDAFAGFWLLKDPTVGCTSGSFSGHHTDGDLLIVSDYTNGGGTQSVQVYKWVGNDATGHIALDADYTPSQCSGSLVNDNACADANDGTINAPWRSGIDQNEFVESGIDMTHLLDGAAGCFTTFLAETRTSQSLSAELKDFAAGQFDTCPPPPVTTAASGKDTLNAPGSAQSDTATVHAVGNRPTPTGGVKFYLCQPGDVSNNTCPAGSGDQVGDAVPLSGGSATSTPDVTGSTTPNDNAVGEYCWRAEYTPDAAASSYYVASVETDFTNECFSIVHGSPAISTEIAPAAPAPGADPLGLGFTDLSDTAHLTGYVGSVTGETVTFKLYGPFTGAVPADCTSGGAVAGSTRTGVLDATGHASTTSPSTTFTPTAAGTYIWIASYPGDTLNDPIAGLCTDTKETATIVGAQIDVTKSANPVGPVSAGTDIGFDITVTNDGSVPAQGVEVTDSLPSGADGVAGGDLDWTLDPTFTGCSITGVKGDQTLDCKLGQVDGSGSVGPIHLTSKTSPADCGTVKNKASVTTSNGTGGDSAVATVDVLCPGLSITKVADHPDPVDVGTTIGFTVTASNTGAGTATGVLVNDPLPTGPGIAWTIDTDPLKTHGPLTCGIDSGTLTCTGSLASGATQYVHVTSPTEWTGSGEAEVNSCLGGTDNTGVYDNTATVSASNVTNAPQASAHEQVLCPDLQVSKSADAPAVNAGTGIGFLVTGVNNGPGSATGALLSDPLPEGPAWSIVGATGPLECGITAGTLTCSGTLAAGESEIVHVTAPTSFALCGLYDNTAHLTATDTPQAPTASASTRVLCSDLTLTKTADAASVAAGGQIGFTVTAANPDGDNVGTALGVVINDPLPGGSGVDWSIASGPGNCTIQGAPSSETLHCDAVDLVAGASESVHVVSGTTTTSCAAYPNVATLTAANAPGLTANADTSVVNCVLVSPPQVSPPAVLPNTGGPAFWPLAGGLALLLGGSGLVLTDQRRRRRS